MSFQRLAIRVGTGCLAALVAAAPLAAQSQTQTQTQSAPPKTTGAQKPVPSPGATPTPPPAVTPPSDYVIGVDDGLSIVFWRDKDMSSDVRVRPDGKITLPLLDEISAIGLTPDQLRAAIVKASMKYLTEEPTVSVIVREINSRRVYITGMVGKNGPYPLSPHMTVVQLIALAGGLQEYAKKDRIAIVRTENGQQKTYFFNYNDFEKGKPAALKQNIELKIGDTVIVP
jgi:polysaccharide export outer membrane protein